MRSPLQGFLPCGFKQGPADSAAAAITGNMEAVNNEPAFIQRWNQHDFANHAVIFISTIGHVPPAEHLFRFFDQARSVPILCKRIADQRQIPILLRYTFLTS